MTSDLALQSGQLRLLAARGLGLDFPIDPYAIGKAAGNALQGKGGEPDGQQPPPPVLTVSPAPPPKPPMSDTTKYVLLGGAALATGIIIYAVATAKRRR